jgi:hypothetical protein
MSQKKNLDASKNTCYKEKEPKKNGQVNGPISVSVGVCQDLWDHVNVQEPRNIKKREKNRLKWVLTPNLVTQI